ncbi:MAG: SEC-C metal-binding domain-containing protein [Fimbriimonas sp.]
MDEVAPDVRAQYGVAPAAAVATPAADIDWKRVGRNDACPCGSGKKFKACHYPALRAEGKI